MAERPGREPAGGGVFAGPRGGCCSATPRRRDNLSTEAGGHGMVRDRTGSDSRRVGECSTFQHCCHLLPRPWSWSSKCSVSICIARRARLIIPSSEVHCILPRSTNDQRGGAGRGGADRGVVVIGPEGELRGAPGVEARLRGCKAGVRHDTTIARQGPAVCHRR